MNEKTEIIPRMLKLTKQIYIDSKQTVLEATSQRTSTYNISSNNTSLTLFSIPPFHVFLAGAVEIKNFTFSKHCK